MSRVYSTVVFEYGVFSLGSMLHNEASHDGTYRESVCAQGGELLMSWMILGRHQRSP